MLVVVTLRRLERAIQQLWNNILELFSGFQNIVQPSEKEIINAQSITSTSEVTTPQEGEFYMIEPSSPDGVDGFLFTYLNGTFDEVTPEKGIIYIVNGSETTRIYIHDGSFWEDVTGKPVDNTLYITDTSVLDSYIDRGIYNVCLSNRGILKTEWYTLTIAANRGRTMIGMPTQKIYIQTLINNNGWKHRSKVKDGNWSEWEEYSYAYTEDITAIHEELSKKQPAGNYAQETHTHLIGDITDMDILPDEDAEIVIPIDSDILVAIVSGTFSSKDVAMFSGHSRYIPLTSEEVTSLVELTVQTFEEIISINNSNL